MDLLRQTAEISFRGTPEGNNGLSAFYYFIDIMQELLSRVKNGQAVVKCNLRSLTDSTHCSVRGAAREVVFDDDFRNGLRDLLEPVHKLLRMRKLDEAPNTCGIYRIRCIRCSDWNYVGRSRNLKQRIDQHISAMMNAYMNHVDSTNRIECGLPFDDDLPPPGVVYEHPHAYHYGERLNEVIEIDILHHLAEHNTTVVQHTNVVNGWEQFYQWLFKARIPDGGGSVR